MRAMDTAITSIFCLLILALPAVVAGEEEESVPEGTAIEEGTPDSAGTATEEGTPDSAGTAIEEGTPDSAGTAIEEEIRETKQVAVIETRLGRIILDFFPEDAPNHVENFEKLVSEGFYDGTTFHRVIPGFIIQGGNPNSKDDDRSNDWRGGGPGYKIDAEINTRKHMRGTVAMAHAPGDPNSAGSQFFICVARQPSLDDKYTIFGQVIEGMDVVDKIVNLERDERDNPIDPVVMVSVTLETREK